MDTAAIKREIRERVWRLLEEQHVARPPLPVRGRIPNFVGAETAALRLIGTPEWKKARIIKVNPDSPQKPVRLLALKHGKIVVMATPRLKRGFIILDPKNIPSYLYDSAATIKGAFRFGRLVGIDELRDLGPIDLIVMGSVAVDKRGHRVGKGEGYAEIEYGIARTLKLVDSSTPIATTIHDLQLVDYIPRERYDLVVDIIVTPRRIIRVETGEPKPPGIIWEDLPCKKLEEIPVLRELAVRVKPDKPCKEG